MGTKAKLKASRRALRQADSARLKALDEEYRARPEIQSELAAAAEDGELQDLVASMLPAQAGRLAAAGWRQRLGGYDGAGMWDHGRQRLRLIHSAARHEDGHVWGHVSVSLENGTLPDWYYVRDTQRLLYPDHAGVVVVAPESSHVDLAEVAHVWTCLTGTPVPDFGRHGTI